MVVSLPYRPGIYMLTISAAGAVVYMISMIFNLFKTKITRAELLALQAAGSTVVTIPALRTGWRAGQHVRIRVPALGLRLGFEGHPFTISSAPDGEGMILMCKNSGDWTRALHKLAQGPSSQRESALGTNAPVDVTMIVEGPHGGLGNTMLPSFSSVLLCAGGSGITHSLALAHDLMTKATTGVVRARTIDLVWVIRTEEAARPLMPTLLDMVNDAKAFEMQCLNDRRYGGTSPAPTALRVKIFVTRCPSSSPLKLANTCAEANDDSISIAHITHEANSDLKDPFTDENPFLDPDVQNGYLSRTPSTGKSTGGFSSFRIPNSARNMPLSSIAAYPKRANFESIVTTLVEETVHRHALERTDSSGVCVTACGPEAMVESCNIAVRSVDADRRRAVGGVDFEEECFGY
jgi:ferric-chelate reductase